MAKLKYLVIHCSATVEGKYLDKRDIINWHTNPKKLGGRGWRVPGYNDLVLLDGTLESIVPFDTDDYVDNWEITNGVKGLNNESRHVCYIGGLDSKGKPKDTRTKEQIATLETYVKYLVLRYPDIQVAGHNAFANKACPCFSVSKWLENLIPDKNIYGLH
jgi:N-acetylmuramoyl-L-alanine amidase